MTLNSKWKMYLRFIFNVSIGFLIVCPILYGLSLSFMKEADIFAYPPKLFPRAVTLENYAKVIQTIPIFRFLFNSVAVSVFVMLGQIVTSSLAAYAFVFFDFKYKKILFVAMLATMMIPGEATIISNYLTMSSLKLLDTYAGLILPFLASAMGIFLIRQFYLTVPKELKEAAVLDGCSDVLFFGRILLPLSVPVLSALSIYTLIGTWNQYMWPMLITNTPAKRTVQIGISMLQFSDGRLIGIISAGCMMILVPSILLFIAGQQRMVQSITAGSVKG